MSEIEESVIRREFPAELAADGDGRTLDIRIVPYNEVARVSDPPRYEPYNEIWMPGAFDRQLNAPNRVSVFVNVEHETGIKGIVGRGSELRETSDGLHGSFRMLDHPDGDKALELVKGGDLTGVSLEFVPLPGGTIRENGLVKRTKARLVNVALVRPSGSTGGIQAYKGAQVLAVRETDEPDEPEPEPDEPDVVTDPAFVDQLLARLGWQPLLTRTVTTRPWDGSAARFTDDQYQRSALFCRPGDGPPKQRCSLPVLEPDGTVNANALGQAAARLNQVGNASTEMKAAAARRLIRYYGQAKMEPPASLRAIASR